MRPGKDDVLRGLSQRESGLALEFGMAAQTGSEEQLALLHLSLLNSKLKCQRHCRAIGADNQVLSIRSDT